MTAIEDHAFHHPSAEAVIDFVLAECARFHELTGRMKPANFIQKISKADFSATLPLSSGRKILCGAEALRRLHHLATITLRESDAAGTVEPEKIYRALKRLVAHRFIEQGQTTEPARIAEVLRAAVDEAKGTRSDVVHFIPCRLIHGQEPSPFLIGPVTFHARDAFNERLAPHYVEYVRTSDGDQQRAIAETLLSDARHYYDGFSWIGEVKILNCDPEISRERADLAVTAAVDVLHVLFGAYATERMAVGGPRLETDRRAHFHIEADGRLDVSCSSNATSEVGFRDGWRDFFRREDVAFLLRAAGKAIESLVDPSVQRPLGTRLTDAFSWFGEAVRERSDAARIVKAANALERLLVTSNRKIGGVTLNLSRRAAAVCYDPDTSDPFDEAVAVFKKAYKLRSDLVHGLLSPFDPEVREHCPAFMQSARNVLCAALGYFETWGALDRPGSDAELANELERLIELAVGIDDARRRRK